MSKFASSIFFTLICAVLTSLAFPLGIGKAQAKTIRIDKPLGQEAFVENIGFYVNKNRDVGIEQILSTDTQEKFEFIQSRFIRFRAKGDDIWLKLSVSNAMKSEDQLLLHVTRPYFQKFNVFQVDEDGAVSSLVALDEKSTFAERPIAYRFLVIPMHMEPNQTADIYINYATFNATEIGLSIETEKSFSDQAIRANAKIYFSYSASFLLSLVALLIFFVVPKIAFFAYSASIFLSLLLVMEFDGNTFQFLWPNLPQINEDATYVLALVALVFIIIFGREVLETKVRHPLSDKILRSLMAGIFICIFGGLFSENAIWSLSAYVFYTLVFSCFVTTGFIAWRRGFVEIRFFMISWIIVLTTSFIPSLRVIAELPTSEQAIWDIFRVTILSDAVFLGLGLFDKYNQERKRHFKNMRGNLRHARQNKKLLLRLGKLEKQYKQLSDMIENQNDDVINTIDKLRVQIDALQTRVNALVDADLHENHDKNDIQQNFAYVENLIAENLASTPARLH